MQFLTCCSVSILQKCNTNGVRETQIRPWSHHHFMGGSGWIAPHILTLALYGVSGQRHAPARLCPLSPGSLRCYLLNKRLGGTQSLKFLDKTKFVHVVYAAARTLEVQPVAKSLYRLNSSDVWQWFVHWLKYNFRNLLILRDWFRLQPHVSYKSGRRGDPLKVKGS